MGQQGGTDRAGAVRQRAQAYAGHQSENWVERTANRNPSRSGAHPTCPLLQPTPEQQLGAEHGGDGGAAEQRGARLGLGGLGGVDDFSLFVLRDFVDSCS